MPEVPLVENVAVVGCGVMGAGIVQEAAKGGCSVTAVEPTEQLLEAGRARLKASLARAEEKGKLEGTTAAEVLSAVRFTTDLAELADSQLVIEAIREIEADKVALYRDLQAVVGPQCVLATNTSSLPVTRLGRALDAPERFLGIHFFNPVPVLGLVELVPGLATADQTVDIAERFVTERLGKTPLRTVDRAGFVVNTLLVPYILAAIRLLDAGRGSAQDIDNGMVLGAGMPLGPLGLADLIGLDTLLFIAESLYDELRDPAMAPPPLLRRHVEAGWYGRKSGRGFFEYDRG
ncbi:MAG: 3-hydroxybutyryl-CoA dehydrogenase [Actinomycetota bacterium]|nr:MAG: 3-hydroxybutyryl-CoA dehydrogenase [Actinomycetota bacterium]